MIGAHPAPGGQGGEWRVETIHVKQQRAVVTLNKRADATTPEKQTKIK